MSHQASFSTQKSSERVGLLARNSFANVVRALSTSALTIVTPLVLVLTLPPANYRAWVLVFGVAAYVAYFDLGLQSTVQAVVGQCLGQGRHGSARSVIWNALKIIAIISASLVLGVVLVGLNVQLLFPAMESSLVATFKIALLILTLGQCATLAANVLTGFYMAYNRTSEPTVVLTISRLMALVSISGLSLMTHDLVWLSCSFSFPLVVGLGYLIAKLRREQIVSKAESTDVSRVRARDLIKFSGPMAIWGICMLLVSGAGVVIIGRVHYEAVAAYSIAMMMVSAVVGLANALVGPLLSELSRMHGAGRDIVTSLGVSLRLNSLLVMFLGFGALLVYPAISFILPAYVRNHLSFGVLALLIAGSILRLTMSPLSLLFVATGRHRRIVLPPILEALLNVTVSFALGTIFGLVGLAWGVLVGSMLGVLLASTWSIKLSRLEGVSSSAVGISGIVIPLVCALPLVIALLVNEFAYLTILVETALSACGLIGSILVAWKFGLKPPERSIIHRLAFGVRRTKP